MSEQSENTEQRVVAAFNERYWADQLGGQAKPLAHYLELFPDFRDLIAAEYAANGEDQTVVTDDGTGAAPNSVERLGPYELESELGRGGQGVVYRAVDTRLGRKVALKVLTGVGPGAEGQLKRFRREAEVASKLDHPGICGVHDTGIDNGIPYIAMRYVEGETLSARIATSRRESGGPSEETFMSFEEVDDAADRKKSETNSKSMTRFQINTLITIIEKSARALHAAHEAGILHRDIKPANIMVTDEDQPVILDFGLARDDNDDYGPSLTQTGDVFGTPAYMSPEQIAGQRVRLDRRADIYSLGVSLYECLTLRRPFEAPTREGLYQAVMSKEAPNPRKINPSIPDDLKVVLETAIEKDRDRRYQTAEAFADDLAAVRESRPVVAKPVGFFGRVVRFTKRRPVTAALCAVMMIGLPLVAGLFGYIYAHRDDIKAQEQARLEAKVEGLITTGFFASQRGDEELALESLEKAAEFLPQSPEVLGGKGIVYLKLKRPESALSVLRSHPSPPGSLRKLEIRALRNMGRNDEAEKLEKEVDTTPSTAFDYFVEGNERLVAMNENRADHELVMKLAHEAHDCFEFAIALSPKPRLSYYVGMATTLARLEKEKNAPAHTKALTTLWPDNGWGWYFAGLSLPNDHEKALECYERAEAINPDIPNEPLIALTYARLRQGEKAKAMADAYIAENPDSYGGYMALTGAYLNLEDYEAALASAKKAIELDPSNDISHYHAAISLGRLGRHDEAVKYADIALDRVAVDSASLGGLAAVYMKAGDLKKGLGLWKRIVDKHPDDAVAHNGYGGALYLHNDFKNAAKHLERALELKPDLLRAISNLAAVKGRTNDVAGAVETIEKAYALDPGSPDVLVNYSFALMGRRGEGDLARARELAEESVKIKPTTAESLGLMAQFEIMEGNLEEGAALLEQAIEIKPTGPALMNLSTVLFQLGQRPKSLEYLRRASEIGEARASYFYAARLGELKRIDECMEAYRRAIAQDPNHAEAHCNLADWHRQRGEFEKAVELVRRGHELGSKRPDWNFPSHRWAARIFSLWAGKLVVSDPKGAIKLWREAYVYDPTQFNAALMLAVHLGNEESPEDLHDPAEALLYAQRAVAATKRRKGGVLFKLVEALEALGFLDSALSVAKETKKVMNGKNDGIFPFSEVEKKIAELEAALSS